MLGQGRYDLSVGFSLFRGSQHMYLVLALAEFLDLGLSGAGVGPDGQELSAGCALIFHERPRLSQKLTSTPRSSRWA